MEGSKTVFGSSKFPWAREKKNLQNSLTIWARALEKVREPCSNFR